MIRINLFPQPTYKKLSPEVKKILHGNTGIQRTRQVAEPVIIDSFKQAKATKEYGVLDRINYGLILPLKNIFVALEKDQATTLDLYKKHNALGTGIDKVKKAYRNYLAAEKAVKAVTEDAKLLGARLEEYAKAGTLVHTYDDLIGLAALQAQELKVSETDYKADLHLALDKGAESLVFFTVNTVRAKMAMGMGLDITLPYESPFEQESYLKQTYIKFVLSLVERIQEAVSHSGQADQEHINNITDAFISGLASIPALGKDLMIIECYAQLVKLRDPNKVVDAEERAELQAARAQLEADVINFFTRQVEDLMNSSKPITKVDLEKIQYQGISLLSLVPLENDLELFKRLQVLKDSLQEIQGQIKAAEKSQSAQQAILDGKTSYTVGDIKTFLTACSEGMYERNNDKTLETLAAENDELFANPLMAGFVEYQKIARELTKADQDVMALNARMNEIEAEFTQTINAIIAEETRLTAVISNFEKAISQDTQEIARLQKVLKGFETQFEMAEKKMQQFAGTDEGVKEFYIDDLLASGRKKYEAKTAELQGQIKGKEASLAGNQEQKALNENALQVLKTDLAKLRKDASQTDEQNESTMRALVAKYHQLLGQRIELSGESIRLLGEHLGIQQAKVLIESGVNKKWGEVNAADGQLSRLRNELSLKRSQAASIMAEMESQLPSSLKFDSVTGTFAVKVFGVTEKKNIENLINSNLDIAKKVTLSVGDAIAGDIAYKRERARKEVRLASDRQALDQKTALEARLQDIEGEDQQIRNSELSKKIRSRLALLSMEKRPVHLVDFEPGIVSPAKERPVRSVRFNPGTPEGSHAIPQKKPRSIKLQVDESSNGPAIMEEIRLEPENELSTGGFTELNEEEI